jgi:hypothetical protein
LVVVFRLFLVGSVSIFCFLAFGSFFCAPFFFFALARQAFFIGVAFRYRRTNPTLIFAPFFLLLPQSGMILFFAPFSRLRRELFCFYAPFAFFTLAQQA